ncbi:MAG TPA: signal peptide peptidase SppA [Bryobacteraceae bacterium]|nr:signal peptide peptidase SppA [Bryobacteraceae bacterium]
MGKFLIGLVAGALLAILLVVVAVFAALRMRAAPPAIAGGSTLVLTLDGDIPERPPVEFPFAIFGSQSRPTVTNIWMMLKMAAADKRINAVVLAPRSIDAGWGKLDEMRSALEQFRKSGKPLWAFLRSPGTREYYLATAAERIYLAPQDPVMLKGMRAEMMFFRGALDKLGVDVQIAHAGKYKDFGDMFTRTEMSPETREVTNSILDVLYGNLVTRIAEARKKSPEEVRALIDKGPFLASEARDAGLVDALRFEDQVFGELKTRLKVNEIKKLSTARYMRIPPGSLGLEGRSRIALLVGQGTITRGSPDDSGLSEQGITSEGFTKLLRRVAADGSIRGVVVRIDSPGGEVTASDDIWREMNLLSSKKPVVISMSDTAASGGYYMAMTGDPILAYPGTYTGSIGVVFGKPNLRGLYGKLGITKDILTRGRFADIDSDYRPLDPAELAKLESGIEASYRDFVGKVAEARKKKFEEIHTVAQGRVWLGAQAKSRGLVDELGGLDRAIELVKQKAKIPAGEKVTLVPYPPRRNLLDVLMRRSAEDAIEAGLESRLGPLARVLKEAETRLRLEGGLLRLMPYAIDVR